MGNTYSIKFKKDNKYYYTCTYECNLKMADKFGKDFWENVINKTDFITPYSKIPFSNPFIKNKNTNKKVDKELFDTNLYDFDNEDQIVDIERYESQYKIYMENKKIDEIFDKSDNSSNSSYDSE